MVVVMHSEHEYKESLPEGGTVSTPTHTLHYWCWLQ